SVSLLTSFISYFSMSPPPTRSTLFPYTTLFRSAYKANGNIPVYENADDALLPLEGWKAENEWQGYIPFDELPTVINPEKGFIATANNKIAEEEYPYHISHVWAQPYRYERIAEVLAAGEKFTVEDMKALQMDQTNL